MKKRLQRFWRTIKRTIVLYRKNQPLMLASATAFFTTFSLPPITILLVKIFSFYFFKADRIRNDLFRQLELTFGANVAEQINTIAGNFRALADSPLYTILGSLFLIFVATTLFYVVQTAIHQIWSIKHNENRRFQHRLLQRGISLLIILAGGILMFMTLLAETSIRLIGRYIGDMYPNLNEVLILILGGLASLVINSIWFAILFKYLPDAKMPFDTALKGGIFTAVLFSFGKYLLGMLLVTDRIGNLFGASASIMVLMLFIFYTSLIVYFGASYTYILQISQRKSLNTKRFSEHVPG